AISPAISHQLTGHEGWHGDPDRGLRESSAVEHDGRGQVPPADEFSGRAGAGELFAFGTGGRSAVGFPFLYKRFERHTVHTGQDHPEVHGLYHISRSLSALQHRTQLWNGRRFHRVRSELCEKRQVL